MRTEHKPSPALGAFLAKWRADNNYTVEEAGQRAGISKSTWSALENATRAASMTTLYGLQRATGMEYDDLARLAGHDVLRSASTDERARRIAAMAETLPRMDALLDLLPNLNAEQTDALISIAESFNRTRQSPAGARRKERK